MANIIKIEMDREEIRPRAYFLSLLQPDYQSLLRMLVVAGIRFRNQPHLHGSEPVILLGWF